MRAGFPMLRERLQQLPGLESVDGVFVQRGLADDPFEQHYLEIRRRRAGCTPMRRCAACRVRAENWGNAGMACARC